MKIVHVVRQFHPAIGGLEEAVGQLTKHLAATGEDTVRVITLDLCFVGGGERLAPRERLGDVEIVRIPYRGSSRYPLALGVLRHIRDADLVHVHAIDFFFDFLSMTRWLHRKPLVASTHGGFFHTQFAHRAKRLWFNTITRMNARGYDAICASSVSDQKTFAAIAPDRTLLVENGVDVERWRGCGSPALQPTLLFLGRFSSNKRIPLLFPLLRELRQTDARWTLIVAGMESDQSEADLRAAAMREGVGGAVDFFVGVGNDALKHVIARASYIVSASAHEGFGLSIVEGLSAGLHPVLSRIPAFEALLAATGHGSLVDVDRPAAAAATLLAQHARQAETYPERFASAVRASERYGWPFASERFRDIYRQVRTAARE